jgi:hypothetical protein
MFKRSHKFMLRIKTATCSPVGVGEGSATAADRDLDRTQVRYRFGRVGIMLEWQHETLVESCAQGNRFQLQFSVPV